MKVCCVQHHCPQNCVHRVHTPVYPIGQWLWYWYVAYELLNHGISSPDHVADSGGWSYRLLCRQLVQMSRMYRMSRRSRQGWTKQTRRRPFIVRATYVVRTPWERGTFFYNRSILRTQTYYAVWLPPLIMHRVVLSTSTKLMKGKFDNSWLVKCANRALRIKSIIIIIIIIIIKFCWL